LEVSAVTEALEVDSYDARQRSGWSVLIKERAELDTAEALGRRRGTGLRTWSPSAPRSDWVVIRTDEVSGGQL
jgi:hypothetical protein